VGLSSPLSDEVRKPPLAGASLLVLYQGLRRTGVDGGKVNEGSDVSFVISVANQGPDAAQNVHLADLVPDVTPLFH